ncbi:MAG TPA: S4 domain-containing protein, partial [Chitinophagaceae bacterium]|nr:S4 domain-containing protein [Chitinophagaceae bacterium]
MNEEEWEDGVDDSGEPVKQLVFDFVIEKGQEPYRIDKYLMNKMSNATRTKIQEAIDEGLVLVNGKSIRPNYKVKPGDHVLAYSYHIPHSEEIIPEDIPLDIVYEDESVMVVNKAWGMVVHP